MEGNSNSSYDYEDASSWSCFSHTSNPERSPPSNTNRQWDDGETDFHRREFFDGERNRESSYDIQENFGRSDVSYQSIPERSPPTYANLLWNDGGQDHKYNKQLNGGFHREYKKSRPYFIKNRGNPHNESNNTEGRQPQQIRKLLQHKAAQLQPSSQQHNRPVYSEYGFNQADLTGVGGNSRPFSYEAERQQPQIGQSLQQETSQSQTTSHQRTTPEYGFNQAGHTCIDDSMPLPKIGEQQQIGRSLQQETFQSQPTSQQETPINSAHQFNQADRPYIDTYTQALPDTHNDINKLTFSNRCADAINGVPPNREEWQHQRVRQPFLRGKSQAYLTPPSQTMPVFPAFGFNSAEHSFTRRPPRMMPPYNYSPASWGMNPMNLPFNSAAIVLPGASALPGTSNVPVASALPIASGVGLGPNTSISMDPNACMGMSEYGNVHAMMGMENYSQFEIDRANTDGAFSLKELITFSRGIMCPPHPEDKPPKLRPRPLGCKTVYVGGLPEKATEEIIREIFEHCGEISAIRMCKKNFCFVRFTQECYVNKAIDLSGYKLKIERKDDPAHCNRLNVNFSYSREDEHEYTCWLRKELREARHKKKMEEEARRKQRMEEEARRVPTPPPVVYYSEKEASILFEKLHGADTFHEALSIFTTWLERGECKKRNVSNFYSMIQSTNSRVRILMNEKQQYEDELNKAKIKLKQKIQDILLQFNEIDKVYTAASVQKVWDHFTKAQRKSIEMWKKQIGEVKNLYLEEVLDDRVEDEMNISDDDDDDDDDDAAKQENKKSGQQNLQEELLTFKEECDSLKCQLITSQNELMELRSEMDKKCELAESQTRALKQAFQGLWQQNVSLNEKHLKNEEELEELRKQKAILLNEGREDWSFDDNTQQKKLFGFLTSSSVRLITENEARLIGLISTFLNDYPLGTNINCICTYLRQIDDTIRTKDVENFMKRFTLAFKEEFIDDSLEKKWTFLGVK